MSIRIFTDGSSRGNPGPGGWGAIIDTGKDIYELGGREDHTTNNRMEIMAAISALEFLAAHNLEAENVVVHSDSKYVINGITKWVSGWQKNGWKTAGKKDVENRDLWERLHAAAANLFVSWTYIEGHAGHPGNERCDEIATSFADKNKIDLYSGPKEKYPVDLDAKPVATKKSSKKSSSAKAYSYLSLIDGILEKYATWAECEARVKGKSGAKFKKAISKYDEEGILKEWGF